MLARTSKNSINLLKTAQTAATRIEQRRWLNLQEYQSKELLQKYGCTVQKFFVTDSKKDAQEKIKKFDHKEYVVKAQILAGGRGKGKFPTGRSDITGVLITQKKDDAAGSIEYMVGHKLITKQTPPEGVLVSKVMVAESVQIGRETYLAILMDRDSNGPVIVASPAGGVDIEEVAEKSPHLIFKEPIDISTGVTDEIALRLAEKLEFKGALKNKAAEEIKRLYKLFIAVDATQVEINPFVETTDNRVFCVDAKLNFDDSAAFRQKEIFAMDDHAEQDPRETEAEKFGLNYIGLDGNIACLVNGAGLAMATMDIIKLNGGEPANFLDVGGSVTEAQVYEAFRIITSDKQVKALLVNIFGGIVNCATIANGLIAAFKRMELKVPLIVRLEGTNVDAAKKLLKESNLPILTANNLDDAAKKAVASIK
uniref:Succinate--CoA ligase [GDP-forming] subunit beta, mitochondrial n=1 Tax=Plectus sambesii TaxID=2011161 RepID=A0A914WK47_9BILA